MTRRCSVVMTIAMALTVLPTHRPAQAAEEKEMIEEVSSVFAEAAEDSVAVGGSDEALAAMKSHEVAVVGKPAGGEAPGPSGWESRCEWVMATPHAGDYVVSLYVRLKSAEDRTGVFGCDAGATRVESPEFHFRGKRATPVKAFRITVPDGQKRTRMFLAGDGVHFYRADICRVARRIEEADGRIRRLAESSYRTVLRAPKERPGEAACLILAPAGGVEAPLARELADALKVGVAGEPELVAPFPHSPSVQGGNADTNLILLSAGEGGPLVRAMRRAEMIGENRAIPGAGGFVIRTVPRPFAGRANVIVISGGDLAGLVKGVRAFAPAVDDRTGELVWDRFLVDSPGERWKKLRPRSHELRDDDPTWDKQLAETKEPFGSAAVDRTWSGHRAYIGRTGGCGTQYWLTGNNRFAEVFKERMFKMERDDIYGGPDSHMALFGLMQGWDRVEESPVFSTEDRLRITNYLLLRCLEGNDGFPRAYLGFHQYSGPVRMRHNHQTILGCGLMQASLYFGRLYGLGRAEVWKAWCDETVREGTWWGHGPEDSANYEPGTFMEVADMLHYQGLSTRGQEGTKAWPQAALRFMAHRDSFSLPACYGDCWDWAEHATTMNFFATMRDDWGWPPAQFAIDRLIRGYRHASPGSRPTGEVYIYLNGSTDVGGLFPPPDPAAVREALRPLLGLAAVPMTEGFWRYMTGQVGNEEFWAAHPRPELIPYERTADKVQYRSGWDTGDEYLLLETLGWANHGHMDLGAIVQYCHGGRLWVVDCGYTNLGAEQHSTLEVKRDGRPAWDRFQGERGRWGDFRAGPQMFEIVKLDPSPSTEIGAEKAAAPGRFSVICRAKDLAGATWLRAVSGGENKGLRIEDTLTAAEAGEYEIVFRLRLLGGVEGEKGAWRVRQKGASLPVTLEFQEGDSVGVAAWAPDGQTFSEGVYFRPGGGPSYPFLEGMAKPGEAESGAPRVIEWKRRVRLDHGQSALFRATLGPAEKTE